MRFTIVMSGILAGAWAGAGAHAGADEGRLVYARGGALWSQAPGAGAPVELARLPQGAPAPDFLESTPDASLLAISLGAETVWLRKGEGTLRTGCRGRARPSPRGDGLVCMSRGSVLILGAARDLRIEAPPGLKDVSFLGPYPELVAVAQDGIVALPLANLAERRLLARPRQSSHLLVAPSGARAVAVQGEGLGSRITSFQLDGEGVPRRLGGPGVPVAWSWDSNWVLIEERAPGGNDGPDAGPDDEEDEATLVGSPWLVAVQNRHRSRPGRRAPRRPLREQPPPETRTCVVRASGGEAKCWNDFTPLAFSPDSSRVLLKKDAALFIGVIAGPHPLAPRLVVDGVDGAATWVR